MIRICFRYGDTRLFARALCFFRGGDSAHCETAHRWIGDVYDCVSASWLDGGVRPNLITMPVSKWRVYEVPGSPDEVRRWAKDHEGEGYDWPAFFGFGWFRRIKGFTKLKHCCEVAADLMYLRSPNRWEPYDLESVCQLLCKAGVARRIQ